MHKLIRELDYENFFLKTLYWRRVATQVKERDRSVCQSCGRQGTLGSEADHLTYKHHGSEHLHLEDLQTLCVVCHRVKHKRFIEAVIAEWDRDRDDGNWFDSLQLVMQGFDLSRAEASEE